MRNAALAVLAIVMISASGKAQAQAWDPNYPVCLQVYGRNGSYYDCTYTSLAQCNAAASGRAAECLTNPYFANAKAPAGPRHRQRRG
jgi:hypothetical protein